MSAEWLRVLCRTEKLGRMSLFELWVAQIKLFLSWTSDILSFLSASKFPHQTFVTWWKNQTQAGKKSKSRTCSNLSAFWAENNQRWRPNADECRRSNNSECLCPEENSNLSCFPLSRCLCPSLDELSEETKKTHAGAKKKPPALRFSARRAPGVYATDLAEISCWNICKQAPLNFPGAFGCLTGFQLGLFVIMFSSYQFFFLRTQRREKVEQHG